MFFDTIKIRNYWPTITTRVYVERFLERKFSDISMYLMANVDWRIPTYFRRFFSFLQEFWLKSHSCLCAAILDLPLFARRPRRQSATIRNRRGRLGTRLGNIHYRAKLFDPAESLQRQEKQSQASLVYYSTISSPLIKRESKLCYFPKICSNTNSSKTWHLQDPTRTKPPL